MVDARPVSTSNYLTPDGAMKLKEEFLRLVKEERPKVVREVADAAAQGDRSENAEYIYGKRRLREIDRRVRFLEKRLENAVVVRPGENAANEVRFGATVDVQDEDGNTKSYMLVGSDEAAPAAGQVSYLSPLGKALLKRKVGDIVTVVRPAGPIDLEIMAIRY